jgi:hypothetical protein
MIHHVISVFYSSSPWQIIQSSVFAWLTDQESIIKNKTSRFIMFCSSDSLRYDLFRFVSRILDFKIRLNVHVPHLFWMVLICWTKCEWFIKIHHVLSLCFNSLTNYSVVCICLIDRPHFHVLIQGFDKVLHRLNPINLYTNTVWTNLISIILNESVALKVCEWKYWGCASTVHVHSKNIPTVKKDLSYSMINLFFCRYVFLRKINTIKTMISLYRYVV